MADFVVVGGVPIKVSPSSGKADWNDAVDRRRSFDNTYRASATGGAARDWHFSTPPITRAVAGTYRAVLSQVQAQMCSGEGLELPTMCCAELIGETPVKGAASNYVSLDFALHESASKRLLLKYSPGDTITGESFARSTTAFYTTSSGVLISAAINAKRDAHYPTMGGTRSVLLEGTRTNGFIRAQEFDNAAWTKSDATVSANATTAPDGTATADKLVEAATTAQHGVYQATTTTASTPQAHTVFAKAGERTWLLLQTNLRDGTTPQSWVNLSTGAIGTKAAGHTIRVTALGSAWFRVEVDVDSGVGAGATLFVICAATADAVSSYAGDITKGIYLWGAQHEQNQAFATSYIPTTTVALARGADIYSQPDTAAPQEMTVYAKFVEAGTSAIQGRVFEISDAAAATPNFLAYSSGGNYRAQTNNGTAQVLSDLAAFPAIGQVTELVARLFGDGSVDIVQSIAGGAETSGAQSASNLPLAAAWSGPLIWLNSGGNATGFGFIALQSLKIVSGTHSLAEMRAA